MGFEVRPASPEPDEEQFTITNPGPTKVRYQRPLYQPTWEDLHPTLPPRERPLGRRVIDPETQEDLRRLERAEERRARRHQMPDSDFFRHGGWGYSGRSFLDSLIFGGWYSGGWYDDYRMVRFVFSTIFMVIYLLAKLGGCH